MRNVARLAVRRADHDASWGGYQVVAEVPPSTPIGTYDVRVAVAGITDRQPNAVRVLDRIPTRFRFVHVSDSQFADPTGSMEPGDRYAPGYGPAEILEQELRELRYLDPAFCVFSGDLLFGADYPSEYENGWKIWSAAGVPVFLVPGNHDGYASTRAWEFQGLRAKPRDGLEYWRRYFGPLDYSFDLGAWHFVALNSYSGAPERRDGFLFVVRNYGGALLPAQLDWLRKDLAAATAAGKRTVVFLHHDPSQPSVPDRPFVISELNDDLRKYVVAQDFSGFLQKWNDAQNWNHEASAKEFLRLVAGSSVTHVLVGHTHHDEVQKVGGVEFVTTTTLSSASSSGYWGYRVLEIDGPTPFITWTPSPKHEVEVTVSR